MKLRPPLSPSGKLIIGSTGKERTDDDGNVVHAGEMWCKSFDESFAQTHEDWREKYGALRGPTKCPHGAGFMIHEGEQSGRAFASGVGDDAEPSPRRRAAASSLVWIMKSRFVIHEGAFVGL